MIVNELWTVLLPSEFLLDHNDVNIHLFFYLVLLPSEFLLDHNLDRYKVPRVNVLLPSEFLLDHNDNVRGLRRSVVLLR